MNHGSSLAAGFIVCLGLSVYALSSPTVATPVPQVQARTTFAYATLTADNETYIFDEGGIQAPREFTMTTLLRFLNSRERASTVNLLNAIGGRGWELVERHSTATGQEWLFKRRL